MSDEVLAALMKDMARLEKFFELVGHLWDPDPSKGLGDHQELVRMV